MLKVLMIVRLCTCKGIFDDGHLKNNIKQMQQPFHSDLMQHHRAYLGQAVLENLWSCSTKIRETDGGSLNLMKSPMWGSVNTIPYARTRILFFFSDEDHWTAAIVVLPRPLCHPMSLVIGFRGHPRAFRTQAGRDCLGGGWVWGVAVFCRCASTRGRRDDGQWGLSDGNSWEQAGIL